MLTTHQLKDNYYALLKEFTKITGIRSACESEPHNFNYEFTPEHWNNLVQVCSIIKTNVNRFDMSGWHGQRYECGTTHCIAGWAESLAKGDTNYDNCHDTFNVARTMLSSNLTPFLFVTTHSLFNEYGGFYGYSLHPRLPDSFLQRYKGIAEQLVMKYLIDPVLEEAKKESYELSTELQEFIKKTQEHKKLAVI
jgi:hypothetical protein